MFWTMHKYLGDETTNVFLYLRKSTRISLFTLVHRDETIHDEEASVLSFLECLQGCDLLSQTQMKHEQSLGDEKMSMCLYLRESRSQYLCKQG
jgi:hypothetical protein